MVAQTTASSERARSIDEKLRVLREVVAATLAVLIVLITVVMLYLVFTRHVGSADENADKHFERAKDLLLFINPLVGVVIGYYFTKVSTEARAEKAEATVATAHTHAQEAIKERNEAKAEAAETKAILNEVVPAAQEVLNESTGGQPGTLGGAESSADTTALRSLKIALERAHRRGV